MPMRPLGALLLLAVLGACGAGGRDVILPGERFDLRGNPVGAAAPNVSRPVALPAARVNSAWTQRGGGPQHRIPHPALNASLAPLFAVPIGQGDTNRLRITADPVVAGGRVFTLDASARVTAVGTNGAVAWTRDLTPAYDTPADASGGGLATDGRRLYVTSGFGQVTALDTATGATLWEQDLDSPGTAAPVVDGGVVFVIGRNSVGWALEADTGRIRYQVTGTPSEAGVGGGAGVAVDDDLALFPFASGEVVAVFRQGGLRRWATQIGGARPGQAANVAADDIGADPVIADGLAYVANVSGRMAAIRLADGERLWTGTEGAVGPVVLEGGSLFFVNDINRLVRVDAGSGQTLWSVQLPLYPDGRREGGRTARFVQTGPVLAGGRLIVGSSDGVLRQFDPASGAALGEVALPGGAASNPVVAGGTLYIVAKDGQLLAFR